MLTPREVDAYVLERGLSRGDRRSDALDALSLHVLRPARRFAARVVPGVRIAAGLPDARARAVDRDLLVHEGAAGHREGHQEQCDPAHGLTVRPDAAGRNVGGLGFAGRIRRDARLSELLRQRPRKGGLPEGPAEGRASIYFNVEAP